MNIGIYLGAGTKGLPIGGAENSVAVLAEVLARDHQVEIVHHVGTLDIDQLARFSGTVLAGVRARYVPDSDYRIGDFWNPWTIFQRARAWQAALSAPYDLFVAFTFWVPPFSHARRSALLILFPWIDRRHLYPWSLDAAPRPPFPLKQLRRAYYGWEWRRRFATYQVKMANSNFTRRWAKIRWGVDCDVVYPPIDRYSPGAQKRNLVMSVGRFTGGARQKRQLEMVSAFRGLLDDPALSSWQYVSAGGLADVPEDQAYFTKAQGLAAGGRIRLLPNAERQALAHLYGEAKIFWHAAGLGDDEAERPERAEHFGMTTPEAMSAGCVPVVIRKGGQPEIVRHGVDGFLWDTLEELGAYTRLLASDQGLWAKMSEAAQARARLFSREEYVRRMLDRLGLAST